MDYIMGKVMCWSANATGVCIKAWLYFVSNQKLKRYKILWRLVLNTCDWVEKPFQRLNAFSWHRYYHC